MKTLATALISLLALSGCTTTRYVATPPSSGKKLVFSMTGPSPTAKLILHKETKQVLGAVLISSTSETADLVATQIQQKLAPAVEDAVKQYLKSLAEKRKAAKLAKEGAPK